ncbi:hypothetical protein BGW80DRAFT_321286 [Lactifluus volemus]|nr:hypothetical protein BGW80DRAFT_321286 [Lactifluus volemus]
MRTHQQQNPTPRPLVIKSPFLLVRFVLFSVQLYLSFTALVFAVWNVGASRAAGAHDDGSSALLIFNGIAISLCITSALMDIKTSSSFSTSTMGFECAWTGIFTCLQIAACISTTLRGPPEFCEKNAPLSICASITILVPISWLAATSLLAYFVAISTLCITHLRLYPALWFTSVYDIIWFADVGVEDKRSSAPQLPPLDTSSATRLSIISRRHSTSSLPRYVENQPQTNPKPQKPLRSSARLSVWWGRLLPGRPGRDHPFRFRRARGPEYQWWANDNVRVAGHDTTRQDPESQAQSSAEPQRLSVSLNEDEPIPLGDRSQWVRAGRTVHPSVSSR